MFKVLKVSSFLLVLAATMASAQALPTDFERGADLKAALNEVKTGAAQMASPAAQADTRQIFKYLAESHPKEDGNCLAIAKRIGAAVEKVGQVKVTASVCENVDENGFKIAVSYEADAELNLVTTDRGFYSGAFGNYPAEQACRAGLPAETQAFRDATGLEPVVSYCRKNSLDKSWTIRIDSFGQARLQPDNQASVIFALPYTMTEAQLLGQIKTRLIEQGVNARAVFLLSHGSYALLSASYYAKSPMLFKLEDIARLDTKEQCDAMLADTSPLLAARSPAPLAAYCSFSNMGGDGQLHWLFKDKPSLKNVQAGEDFATYKECEAGRERVAQYYRTTMGHSVAGAICSNDDLLYRKWKVRLLED